MKLWELPQPKLKNFYSVLKKNNNVLVL